MRIAVIIVTFNAGDDLKHCLEGIKNQQRKPDRCLVIDNGSRDSPIVGNEPWLEGIELHRNSSNEGFAAANNWGALLASDADWIAFLNPDAVPEADWLLALENATKAFPSYQSFACRQLSLEAPSLLDGAGDALSLAGRPFRRGFGAHAANTYITTEPVFSGCGAAMMIRRDLFLAVQGFDEDFFCYLEDVDLGFRVRHQGESCLYVPDAVVHHRGSGTTGFRSRFSTYHGHRNMVWLLIKNMPAGLLTLTLPLHLLVTLGAFLQCARRGQGMLFCFSKWHALKELPRMLRKRKAIQSTSKAPLSALLKGFQTEARKGSRWIFF